MLGSESPSPRTRARRLIEEYPGLHLRELARQLDMDVRAVQHHLDRLEKKGLVTVLRFGRYKRYFPRREEHRGEVVDRKDKRILAHLRSPLALGLVVHLIVSGPTRLADLSSGVGVGPSTASYHLRRLEGAGIVVRGSQGATKYAVEDPEKLRRLLRVYGPTPNQVDGLLELWEAFVGEEEAQ